MLKWYKRWRLRTTAGPICLKFCVFCFLFAHCHGGLLSLVGPVNCVQRERLKEMEEDREWLEATLLFTDRVSWRATFSLSIYSLDYLLLCNNDNICWKYEYNLQKLFLWEGNSSFRFVSSAIFHQLPCFSTTEHPFEPGPYCPHWNPTVQNQPQPLCLMLGLVSYLWSILWGHPLHTQTLVTQLAPKHRLIWEEPDNSVFQRFKWLWCYPFSLDLYI